MGIIDTGIGLVKKIFSGADDMLGSAFAKNSIESYSNMTTPEWKHAAKTASKDEILYKHAMKKTMLDRATKEVLEDSDSLFKYGGQQTETVYKNINNLVNNEKRYQDFIERQYNFGKKGMFSGIGFEANTYADLTDAQKSTIQRKAKESLDGFNAKFNGETGFQGAQKQYNQSMIVKQIGIEPNSKEFDKRVKSSLKSARKKGFEEEKQAYVNYLKKAYDNGESFMSERQYYSKEYGWEASDIDDKIGKKVANTIATGNPDHSGLHLWQKAKRHPAIATGIVMGTAWGVSELTEDDSF